MSSEATALPAAIIQDDESPRPLTRPNAYFMVVEYEEDE
jgi:hypothetical protein